MSNNSEVDKQKNSRFRLVRIRVDVYKKLKKLADGTSFGEYIAQLIGIDYSNDSKKK